MTPDKQSRPKQIGSVLFPGVPMDHAAQLPFRGTVTQSEQVAGSVRTHILHASPQGSARGERVQQIPEGRSPLLGGVQPGISAALEGVLRWRRWDGTQRVLGGRAETELEREGQQQQGKTSTSRPAARFHRFSPRQATENARLQPR